jgi:hypothetical protein
VRINKICVNVGIGKHMCEPFLIYSCPTEGDALQPVLFNFVLRYKYASRNVQEDTEKLTLNDTHHYLHNVLDDVIPGDIPYCEE